MAKEKEQKRKGEKKEEARTAEQRKTQREEEKKSVREIMGRDSERGLVASLQCEQAT